LPGTGVWIIIVLHYKTKFHIVKPNLASAETCSYSVQVLQRAMGILDALLESRAPLSLEQICSATSLPKSTAFRIIINLLHKQYLVETNQGYWLGLKMLRFGTLVEETIDLKQIAQPYLIQLRDAVNETVHLAVLDNDFHTVYLEKLSTQRAVGIMKSRVGSTAPTHCTGVGKALAAYRPDADVRQWLHQQGLPAYTENTLINETAFLQELATIRQNGFAIDRGEHEASVHCIAAPVWDHKGEVIAAISVSAPRHRMPLPPDDDTWIENVKDTAFKLSRALGFEGIQQMQSF
jgi:IclR family KDG regulon transcriptional repressor